MLEPGVRGTVELVLRCSTPREAEAVWAALAADDPGSIQGEVEGPVIRITVGPAGLASLRATIDDVLACFTAAVGAAAGGDGTEGGG